MSSLNSSSNPKDETTPAEDLAAMRAALERKSTVELFAATLKGEYDDDAPWEAVHVLRRRGTAEVFEAARQFCQSENPRARAMGLSVLAQLGAGKPDEERPFMAESVVIAIRHLADSDPEVVSSAARALSNLDTEPAVASLIGLRSHTDPDVRQAVACSINLRRHSEAVPTLCALMEDENEEVRDCATFSLGVDEVFADGVWSCSDSPEIRAALRRRLHDTCEDARREAIWGLAKRKDPLGLKLLLDHLESEESWSGDETAAAETLDVKSDTSIEDLCQGLQRLLSETQQGEIAKS
jgi:HEAT repeat protein